MPTHFHGIFMINSNCRGEVPSPLRDLYKMIKKGGPYKNVHWNIDKENPENM
jgi:hypothetical protein